MFQNFFKNKLQKMTKIDNYSESPNYSGQLLSWVGATNFKESYSQLKLKKYGLSAAAASLGLIKSATLLVGMYATYRSLSTSPIFFNEEHKKAFDSLNEDAANIPLIKEIAKQSLNVGFQDFKRMADKCMETAGFTYPACPEIAKTFVQHTYETHNKYRNFGENTKAVIQECLANDSPFCMETGSEFAKTALNHSDRSLPFKLVRQCAKSENDSKTCSAIFNSTLKTLIETENYNQIKSMSAPCFKKAKPFCTEVITKTMETVLAHSLWEYAAEIAVKCTQKSKYPSECHSFIFKALKGFSEKEARKQEKLFTEYFIDLSNRLCTRVGNQEKCEEWKGRAETVHEFLTSKKAEAQRLQQKDNDIILKLVTTCSKIKDSTECISYIEHYIRHNEMDAKGNCDMVTSLLKISFPNKESLILQSLKRFVETNDDDKLADQLISKVLKSDLKNSHTIVRDLWEQAILNHKVATYEGIETTVQSLKLDGFKDLFRKNLDLYIQQHDDMKISLICMDYLDDGPEAHQDEIVKIIEALLSQDAQKEWESIKQDYDALSKRYRSTHSSSSYFSIFNSPKDNAVTLLKHWGTKKGLQWSRSRDSLNDGNQINLDNWKRILVDNSRIKKE